METIALARAAYIGHAASSSGARPSPGTTSARGQTAGDGDPARLPPDCAEARAIALRLDMAIADAGPDRPDQLVELRLADLRRMDAWGITIHGETLRGYFDLGSIDDVEQRYPVTADEARLLRDALVARNSGACPSAKGAGCWRRTV